MLNKKIKLVLASSSERRLSMLEKIGYKPLCVHNPNIKEEIIKGEKPSKYVVRMAEKKAKTAVKIYNDAYILGADTVIVSERNIIGKPKNYKDAYNILAKLSGKRHRVYGGICLISPKNNISIRTVVTQVNFRHISTNEIESYLKMDEWKDKAGSYGIQGHAAKFVKRINGNYDNIVGLSLADFYSMIKGLN